MAPSARRISALVAIGLCAPLVIWSCSSNSQKDMNYGTDAGMGYAPEPVTATDSATPTSSETSTAADDGAPGDGAPGDGAPDDGAPDGGAPDGGAPDSGDEASDSGATDVAG